MITAEQDWREHIDVIVDSICSLGRDGMRQHHRGALRGRRRTAGARDRRTAVRASLRCRISDERAALPVQRQKSAKAVAEFLARRAAGSTPLLGADQVVADLGDGTAALRPAVHLLSSTGRRRSSTPSCRFRACGFRRGRVTTGSNRCATPWSSPPSPMTTHLIDDLIDDPTVANVYSGQYPT